MADDVEPITCQELLIVSAKRAIAVSDPGRGGTETAVPSSLTVPPFDTLEDYVLPRLPFSRSRERGTDICPEAARPLSILGHQGFRRLRLA